MREKKSREGEEEDRGEEQRSLRPAMGKLLLVAARRWSSCSWTTGGSGHEQGRLAAVVGWRRKSREVDGGAGWVEKDREGIPRGFG